MPHVRFRPRLAVVVALLLAGALAGSALIRPSNNRDWISEHQRLPGIRFDGDRVTIEDVRCFVASSESTATEDYAVRTYDLSGLESVWLGLAVFDKDGWRGPAHSMLSFGFAGGDYVVISVEARKEVGERYSIWKGLAKRYEVIYVIGDERDLVRTRAVFRPDEVYLYPIRTTRDRIRALFVDMLETAQSLRDRPQFYNTATNNCTTKLRDHVNHVVPGRIPAGWRVLLPGYSDELLEELELLDTEDSVEDARVRYRINDRAARFRDDPEFSRRIRGS